MKLNGTPYKQCIKCKKIKLKTYFSFKRTKQNTRKPTCKQCDSEYANKLALNKNLGPAGAKKLYYETHKELLLLQKKEYSKKIKEQKRFYDIYRKFKLTKDEYLKIKQYQNDMCPCCGRTEEILAEIRNHEKSKRLVVDHDHYTGKIRGLLCSTCNSALGLLGDSVDVLENMITYLKSHERFANENISPWNK